MKKQFVLYVHLNYFYDMSSADCNFMDDFMFLSTCRAFYALLPYKNT